MSGALKNIVLIGFMASGKTLAAKMLSKRLNRKLVSTDALIVAQEGRSITQIFKEQGEEYFRQKEHAVIQELAGQTGLIIDCGGGLVLNPKNIALLKQNGIIFHLRTTPEVIFERVKGDPNRPLLNVPDPLGTIRALYAQRLPLYSQADVEVDSSSSSIEGAVDQILKRM